jgi:peptidyl-prolyl cis-trans isomerase C
VLRSLRLPLLPILILCAACARAEIKEQIVAVVNDEIITYSELEKILAPLFEQYERIYSGAELFSMLQKARRDVLDHLVMERLILQEAKRQNVKAMMGDDFTKEVERMVAEARNKFPSEDEFIKRLKRDGSTIEKFRAEQEARALVQAMLAKEISSRCGVSPMEVRDYYETHKKEFTEDEKIHVSQIWIKEDPKKPGEAEKRATYVLAMLDAGQPFAELAKKYSDCPYADRGGDWGFISRGHWNKELEDAAFALEPGKHSGVVKSALGYHIVMLHEKKAPSVRPLGDVYAEIENRLFAEKATAKRDEWIGRLKRKSYISIVK